MKKEKEIKLIKDMEVAREKNKKTEKLIKSAINRKKEKSFIKLL